MAENPLINVGELTKPATVLIERISDAIGLLYAPRHVRRMAAAEADAAKIAKYAQIDISEIERRAMERCTLEEGKHQHNMESIIKEALGYVKKDANPEDIEEDWITSFFSKCRNISNREMQSLWARVLAGETNKPGSFSPRTLEFLPSLSKYDASVFTELCTFCWDLDSFGPTLLVFDDENEVYMKHRIFLGTLQHLDSIGLISLRVDDDYYIRIPHREFTVSYFGRSVRLRQRISNKFYVGKCMLTAVGRELAPISGAQPSEHYFQWASKRITGRKYYLFF